MSLRTKILSILVALAFFAGINPSPAQAAQHTHYVNTGGLDVNFSTNHLSDGRVAIIWTKVRANDGKSHSVQLCGWYYYGGTHLYKCRSATVTSSFWSSSWSPYLYLESYKSPKLRVRNNGSYTLWNL